MQVYLDHNASTPLAPEVAEVMRPLLSTHYGNPSSTHWAGLPAKQAVERARAQVADLLGCGSDEVIFTSGGTEANNQAIKGSWYAKRDRGNHIITSSVEHPAVVEPCRFCEREGATVTWLPVDGTGRVDPDELRRAITSRTILITIMHANNEVGTIEPIEDIARIAAEHEIAFHTDAAQSAGKIETNTAQLGVDLLSLAGHKLYAPKGIGALYIKAGTDLESLMHGAGHEGGRRAGTENVILAAGLGQACQLAADLPGVPGMKSLRDRFWQKLRDAFGERVQLNGHAELSLPNTLNVSFADELGPQIIDQLDGVAVSAGAACHAGTTEISSVLKAMGTAPDLAAGSIRFSLGRANTQAEIDYVLEELRRVIGTQLR
jgi:cysteine desulfurase